MSKGNYQTRPIQNVKTPEPVVPQNRDTGRREVEKHRQCPLCYSGMMNGVGQANGTYAKSQTLGVRYYKCDKCGHSWSVTYKPEEIVQIKEIFEE